MKIIKKIIPLVLLFLSISIIGISCKGEDNQKEEETDEFVYSHQMVYSGAVAQINNLNNRQEILQPLIINETATSAEIEEYYNNIEQINVLEQITAYIQDIQQINGPIGPIIIPPVGCLSNANCDPLVNLKGKKGIVLHPDLQVENITLFDTSVGDAINNNFLPGDMFMPDGVEVQELLFGETDFTNITKFYFHVILNSDTQATVEVPITIE